MWRMRQLYKNIRTKKKKSHVQGHQFPSEKLKIEKSNITRINKLDRGKRKKEDQFNLDLLIKNRNFRKENIHS